MKQPVYLFFLLMFLPFIFFGCHKKNEDEKNETNKTTTEDAYERLSKEELVPILKDVLLLESAVYFKANQGADVKTLTYFYYNRTFKKHNVSRPQFYNSLKYYLQRDVKASFIFLGAINMLTVETDSVRKSETSLKEPDMNVVPEEDNKKKPSRFFGKRPK